METSIHVVRQVYDRFAEGDLQSFLNLCSEEIEWVVNGPSTLEKCQAFYGKDGVQTFLNILSATWQFHSFQPRQFIQDGSTVVVLGEETGIDKQTGESFSNRWVHVFDVQNQLIVRFREFLCHWTGDQQPPTMTW
jgi:uncharacterized protein